MQMKTSSPSDFRKSSIGFWRSRESAERSRSRTQLVGQCCACKFCNSPSPQQVFSIKATASVWDRARNIPSWQWSRIWIYLWFFVSLKWTFSAEIIFERNHYNMFSDGGLAQSVSRCLESYFSMFAGETVSFTYGIMIIALDASFSIRKESFRFQMIFQLTIDGVLWISFDETLAQKSFQLMLLLNRGNNDQQQWY